MQEIDLFEADQKVVLEWAHGRADGVKLLCAYWRKHNTFAPDRVDAHEATRLAAIKSSAQLQIDGLRSYYEIED